MCLCPAATLIEGPPDTGPSAICGVMAKDRQRAGLVNEADSFGVLVTAKLDPSSYSAFCVGSYVECPIWRSEKQRLRREGRRLLSADLA